MNCLVVASAILSFSFCACFKALRDQGEGGNGRRVSWKLDEREIATEGTKQTKRGPKRLTALEVLLSQSFAFQLLSAGLGHEALLAVELLDARNGDFEALEYPEPEVLLPRLAQLILDPVALLHH
jgi:hypothetical protein